MGPEITAGIMGAAAALVVGLPSVWYMRRSHQIAVQQLVLDKESAERERRQAEQARDESQRRADAYRRRLADAPTRFTNSLELLILAAAEEATRTPGQHHLLAAARALVTARDGFRSSLDAIRDRLNSEIDQLDKELARRPVRLAEIAETIDVLKRRWPAKKEEVELAVQRVITELGLVPQG